MAEPTIRVELTEQDKIVFKSLLERGYNVYRTKQGRMEKIVVEKPRRRSRSQQP